MKRIIGSLMFGIPAIALIVYSIAEFGFASLWISVGFPCFCVGVCILSGDL